MQWYGLNPLKSLDKLLNGTSNVDRVAEGEAILASIFDEVAIAA